VSTGSLLSGFGSELDEPTPAAADIMLSDSITAIHAGHVHVAVRLL
jgi:hypothetical protein